MWGAFARIFGGGGCNNNNRGSNEETQGGDAGAEMDRTTGGGGEARRNIESDTPDTYDTRQAKQRASVKWLLSKAFNNKVPEHLKEPFYRDHENQEHLKPQIVGALANAEMYCLALGNIYSDPNYHNLNHWAILQTLSRKGAFVAEPSDSQLTETTLIQTHPLKLSAHMAVIESIMTLYAKEVATPDRVMAAIQRFGQARKSPVSPVPDHHEQGLLCWVNHTNEALTKRMEQDVECGRVTTNGDAADKPKIAPIPKVRDLNGLCDGVALAGLISYYCSDELPWTDIRVAYLPTVSDSLNNLGLVQDFCTRCLPASVFHMLPEDITYMRGTMKQNLVVFLADLFNLLEIHPVKCVRYPGMDKISMEGFPARNAHGVAHKRNLPPTVLTPIPDLRSGLADPIVTSQPFQVTRTPTHQPLRKTNSLQQSVSEMSEDSLRRGSDESFVVHRGKNIPTLSSIMNDEPLAPARIRSNKEKLNNDTKADERGDNKAAGRPSNWNENKRTFAGRRSRRNSTSDDSQLTIENFGGSQDNINFIGRNPDKEVGVHVGRKISAPAAPIQFIENPAVRSSLQDARGSIQLGYDNGCEKHETELENNKLKRQMSSDDVKTMSQPSSQAQMQNQSQMQTQMLSQSQSMSLSSLKQERNKENAIIQDLVDGEINNRVSFADLNKKDGGIQLVYMHQDRDRDKDKEVPSKSSFLNKSNNGTNGSEKKTTTFATLPNTTTWQQQSTTNYQQPTDSGGGGVGGGGAGSDDGRGDQNMATQLNDIRLKLEEKRRQIENEKRRMEVAMNKQRQKVGKAAFLQAVVKGKGNLVKSSSDAMVDSLMSGGGCGGGGGIGSAGSASPVQGPSEPSKPSRPISLKEISDDMNNLERKWIEQEQPFIETRRTPDMENMDLETYQQSISQMNSSLHDIQADMQRLASQQNQMHKQMFYQQQQQQQNFQPPRQMGYSTQQSYNPQYQQGPVYNLQSSASAPHIPQSLYQQGRVPSEPQFFLHNQEMVSAVPAPVAPQRRTWAQQAQPPPVPDVYQPQPEMRTWGKPQNPSGFILHDGGDRYQDNRYHNGSGDHSIGTNPGFTLSQQHQQHQMFVGSHHSTPSTSPQHRQHRQISQLLDNKRASPVSLQNLEPVRPERKSNVIHAPIPAPSVDDMAPQSISFIGNPQDEISESLSRLNITSGSRTYRIPSPTRPQITRNSFQPSPPSLEREPSEIGALENADATKGFYISFDNEQPKRPKPPLRTKKGGSPKKERSYVEEDEDKEREAAQEKVEKRKQLERELENERMKKEIEDNRKRVQHQYQQEQYQQQYQPQQYQQQYQPPQQQQIYQQQQFERQRRDVREPTSQEEEKINAASSIIIGNDLSNPDPDIVDERERKKERILMMSLQRRQQQEELKEKKEAETHARREREKAKEEEKLRKKEEQVARRQAILEQHKLKKALEEAEREGKDVDKSLLNSLKSGPKLRAKGPARPRPKTIHIDSGSVEMAEGMLHSSRGKKGSNTNLTANLYTPSTMKRDYYRGSQDSLASSGLLYKDSPDDSRGMSPCHSANQTLGRRSSYKTSRDPSPAQTRGRPKYSTYQNFKGRKSNSMMNLYGSSTDQDSLAYRYGDTDSGLGRATPPRRAPSPGMGPMRHLPSPSGPGSLPGLMSKRRVFDDGSSDISSTPSSMMDYNGPRLYKQPATKSNRGIMLNAVEYCVFPGAVNREAKQRVLEEIGRSESKHFLILFRDAGCQFRALYSYCPDKEEVAKLYGTGPKQVNDRMFDKFFKYNSGGKCFAQVHTKHLTVTIDAFTIHNSLWQGKKANNLPSKKDMALVI